MTAPDALARVRTLARLAREADEAAVRARAVRDAAVRDALVKHGGQVVAEAAGMSRARVYQVRR